MNLTQTIFFDRAVTIGARLLTASVYADFRDRLDECETETDLPYASMGADWCDCLPDWPDILLPASLEMAMLLSDLCRTISGLLSGVPDLLGRLYYANGAALPNPYAKGLSLDWDQWLADIPVPDRGPTAIDFTVNNLVFDALGTGCGILDCGWKWPDGWNSVISGRFLDLDFEAWFPDWEDRAKSRARQKPAYTVRPDYLTKEAHALMESQGWAVFTCDDGLDRVQALDEVGILPSDRRAWELARERGWDVDGDGVLLCLPDYDRVYDFRQNSNRDRVYDA